MAEHFVMNKLINACFEYLKDQFIWQTSLNKELEELQKIQPQIEAVMFAYSQKHFEYKDLDLNYWYWRVRDAIDEAADVLDEFEYWKLESKNSSAFFSDLLERFINICQRGFKCDPNLKKLEEVVHRVYEISTEVSAFLHLVDFANQHQLELRETRETGSMGNIELIGRRNEMEFVMQWLMRNPNQRHSTDATDLYRNISLLSVVGYGGMGKTTLLQHVYKDATALFDVQMWVCVSINFDAEMVIRNILESLQNQRLYWESLAELQNRLQSEVSSKRFLLVFDDIWEADEGEWENVLAPLQYGSLGSKILITTQIDSVASMFAKMMKKRKETMQLKGLDEDECLQLLNKHAFAGVENPDDEFRSIAGMMVEKLSGYPLAAKVIGGILNSCIDKKDWRVVLCTIVKLQSEHNYLLSFMKLIFKYLPKSLQKCFSFCRMFPQDHEFDKDDLVRMWIALGFIESSNIQEETLEDIGRRYFDILVQKMFFDEFHTYHGKVYYKMHDLLHELAQFVSAQECFRIVDDRVISIPKTTRHLSINGINSSLEAALEKMGEVKILHSLFLSFSYDAEYDENVLSKILEASQSIRLLVIFYPRLQKIPDTIDCLIHLRYLKVESFLSFNLPRSISHLYHLQFIIEKRPNLEMDNIGWKELMPNQNCQLILDELHVIDPFVLPMEPLISICSPSMALPVHDRASLIQESSFESDDESDVFEMAAIQGEMSDSDVSFYTCIDDDSSSNTTEIVISQNGRLKKKFRFWMRGDLLGSGAFGTVYKGICDDGTFIAVKEASLLDNRKNTQECILQLEQEIALLSQLEHENIVEYYGTDKDDSKLYIFLELVTQGSIVSLYQKYDLQDTQVTSYTRQILKGLNYLHERNWVHRDIKCSNILVHANGSIKLSDFGLAKMVSKYNGLKSCKGSVYWMVPEVIRAKTYGYGSAVDIWSLGCTVLEMLTRQHPYPKMEWQQAMFKIGRGVLPPMPGHLSHNAKDFIIKCVQVDPNCRPTAAQLLEHPFVTRRPLQT